MLANSASKRSIVRDANPTPALHPAEQIETPQRRVRCYQDDLT